MSNQLFVSALFHKGKLIQLGDIVQAKVEFLDTKGTGRFNHYNDGGTLTKIIVEVDTISNTCYLNHGFTYNSIGGLGYKFEFDYHSIQYAFESDAYRFPWTVVDRMHYLNTYYNHSINKDKRDNLVSYFNIPNTKNIGSYLKKYHRDIFDYICLTFRIRFGEFGEFRNNNELNDITFKVLREIGGYDNNVNNPIHNLTSNNKGENHNSLIKSL